MSNLMDDPLTPDWFETPVGQYLLAAEQAYFDQEVVDVFGFNAFQLGFTRFDFLRANRVYIANSQRRLYFTYIGGPVFAGAE